MPPRRCTASAAAGQTGSSDSESDLTVLVMRCLSCEERYIVDDAGTCRECYQEANEAEEELRLEIDDLKSKVSFLTLSSPALNPSTADIVLVAVDDSEAAPIRAHKHVLVSQFFFSVAIVCL